MSNDKPKPEPVVWLTEEEWDFIRDTRGFWEPSGVNRYITAKHGNPGDIDWALANAEHWMRECEELERQLAEAQRDLLTREEGGEWVSRCDHEDALADVKECLVEIINWPGDCAGLMPGQPGPSEIAQECLEAIDTAMKEGE